MKTLEEKLIEILDKVVNDNGLFNEVRKELEEQDISEEQYESVLQRIGDL